MSISPLWLVLAVLFSIIPSLIVAVVLSTRFEALRGDTTVHRVEVDAAIKQNTTNDERVNEAIERSLTALQLSRSLEESFTRLNNKLIARERSEKAAATRQRKQQQEDEDEEGFIPGTEQMTLPFPMPPQEGGDNGSIVKSRRKFGSIPT
jgi:Mg-chelatase subunit ChlI